MSDDEMKLDSVEESDQSEAEISKSSPNKRKSSGNDSSSSKTAKPSPATLTEKEGKALILKYLQDSNRPYAHNNIFDNLHGQVKKSAVPRLLEELANEGKIQAKTYNKTVVYLTKQSDAQVNQEELDRLDQEINNKAEELKAQKLAVQLLAAQVNQLNSEPDDALLDKALKEINDNNSQLSNKLKKLQTDKSVLKE
jgi:hypothetical protein